AKGQMSCSDCNGNALITWFPGTGFQPPSSYTVSFKVSVASWCYLQVPVTATVGGSSYTLDFAVSGCSSAQTSFSYQRGPALGDISQPCIDKSGGLISLYNPVTVTIAIAGSTVTVSLDNKRMGSHQEQGPASMHYVRFGNTGCCSGTQWS